MIKYRQAKNTEINDMKSLLWDEGPNEWNYLTQQGIDDEFELVRHGQAIAVVAESENKLVGLAVLITGQSSPDYLLKYQKANEFEFVGDVVVASGFSGQGIATTLLELCKENAQKRGVNHLLIERHEENLASAGMMKKAGFVEIDKFYDPQKREVGSRNSVILKVAL